MSLTRLARVKRLSRPLLVTFDAYGTLYRPRAPIHLMYNAVAKEHGMRIQGPKMLNEEFGKALRKNQSIYPNYGKNQLNSPDEWWSMVVNETFKACAAPGQKVPRHLASDLINRFSGSAFYQYLKSVPSTIKTLRNIEANSDFPVIIGVISNSDPRIASILRSLGFSVGDDEPMRHMQPVVSTLYPSSSVQEQQQQPPQPPLIDRAKRPDFDFVLASYDAEYQKPEREIFGLAERYAADMMRRLPAPATDDLLYPWPYPFYRLHVGDDINKDAVAAANAGWKALVYEDRAFLRKLRPEEDDALSRDKTPRCIDLLRGVKKIVNDWCELQHAEVEISENSKEGRERLAKEARKRAHRERKKLELDPEKLAAVYERAVEEQVRQSTPEKYDAGQVKYTAPATSQQQSSGSEHTTASPSSSSPSSSSSLPPRRSRRAKIKANSATGVKSRFMKEPASFLRPSNLQAMRSEDTTASPSSSSPSSSSSSPSSSPPRRYRRAKIKANSATGVKSRFMKEPASFMRPSNLQAMGSEDTTASPSSSSPSSSSSSPSSSPPRRSRRAKIKANSATGVKSRFMKEPASFLRPSNLQAMRNKATPPEPQQKQEQKITRSLKVRQQRALQRQRGKLLKRLPEMQHVPVFVPDTAVNKWQREKKKIVRQVAARKEEKLQRQQGFKSDMDGEDFNDDERLLRGDNESRSESMPSAAEDGGGAARNQEDQDASTATDAPTPSPDVDDATKKTDSSG